MSAYRQQVHLDAPLEAVWSLVGAPSRYPEWWPRVIEVRGERFEQGDEYVQVTREPIGDVQAWLDQLQAHWNEQLRSFKRHVEAR